MRRASNAEAVSSEISTLNNNKIIMRMKCCISILLETYIDSALTRSNFYNVNIQGIGNILRVLAAAIATFWKRNLAKQSNLIYN